MEIRKEFTFSAAHYLPNVPIGHKCGRMHGHTYRVVLVLDGPLDPESGWVLDFGDVSALWKERCHSVLDHTLLNDQIVNPTAELLCFWIHDRLIEDLPLRRIEVWETPTAAAALDVLSAAAEERVWGVAHGRA